MIGTFLLADLLIFGTPILLIKVAQTQFVRSKLNRLLFFKISP